MKNWGFVIFVFTLAVGVTLFATFQKAKTAEIEVTGAPAPATVVPQAKGQPAAPPTAPRITVAVPVPPRNQDFARLADEVERHFPRNEDIRKKSGEEVHHTPPEIISASQGIAKMQEAMIKNPNAIAEGIIFYQACVKNDDIVDAIRAMCLRDLRYWSKKTKPPTEFSESNLPENIRAGADALPKFPE